MEDQKNNNDLNNITPNIQNNVDNTIINPNNISLVIDEKDETGSSKGSEGSESCSSEIREKINFLLLDSRKNYEYFKKYNNNLINTKINDEMNMNIKYEKEFKEHIQRKLNKLDNRLNILQMKYNTYKKWYDRFNIMIIMISTLLSFYEAFKLELLDIIDSDNESLLMFLNLIPIFISSTITCSAEIIKFKKYQEKMENMQFTREKVINSISKLKNVQESLWFSNGEKEFQDIKIKYLEDVYNVYNESNSELERHIKFNDHHKFFKMYRAPPKEKNIKIYT